MMTASCQLVGKNKKNNYIINIIYNTFYFRQPLSVTELKKCCILGLEINTVPLVYVVMNHPLTNAQEIGQ